jgi:hypothetical protein
LMTLLFLVKLSTECPQGRIIHNGKCQYI